jgi:hypothetical protein
MVAPDSETRSCGVRGGALCAVVVSCAAALLAPSALAAYGDRDPTVLWSEYPLDPSRASRGQGAGRVEANPAAVPVAPVNAGALVGSPDETSGVPVWLVLLLVSTCIALAGMGWLTLAARRQSARWSVEPAAPRRRSWRPPRRNASSNGSVPLEAPDERTSLSGIRYRD